MIGWDSGYGDITHYANVYDKDYRESLALGLKADGTLTLQAFASVTLDAKGVANLRRKLQQVERMLADRS